MTIAMQIAYLRDKANRAGGDPGLIRVADTLEQLCKALAEAEYQTDCQHCVHRGDADGRAACMRCDMICSTCDDPCVCSECYAGNLWEWRVTNENA